MSCQCEMTDRAGTMSEPGAALTAPALVNTWMRGADMADRICSVDGCARQAVTRGWCSKHYQRWRAHGDPTVILVTEPGRAAPATCSVDDCHHVVKAHGFCATHLQRWRKHGDPYTVAMSSTAFKPGHPNPCGADSPGWKGDAVGYFGAHNRVYRTRGRASEHACAICGGSAKEWSYTKADPNEKTCPNSGLRYSVDPSFYEPLCARCHHAVDQERLRHNIAGVFR